MNLKRLISFHDYYHLLFLILLAILTHIIWFTPGTILTNSDWGHYQQNVINELHKTAGSWVSYESFGKINIQLPFYGFMVIWSLLGNLGLTYDTITKLTFFIPISFLNFIAPYVLFKSVFKDKNAALVGAIFYGTTSYGVANQPPIHLVYALAPLVIYRFIKAVDGSSAVNWIYFLVLYSIAIAYEIRIAYIVTLILFLYVVFFKLKQIFRIWRVALVILPLAIGLNFYWILATVNGATVTTINNVANRGLFGSNLFDLKHALTLTNWYWTGATPNNAFVKQIVPLQLWIFPAVIIFYLTQIKNNQKTKWILFFLTLSLSGIFLTKQVAEPFVSAYPWLYNYFPGFNLFRESSKFFILSSLGYAGLLCGAFVFFRNSMSSNILYRVCLISIICLSLYNTKPLITGELGGLFVSRHIPQSYVNSNKFFEDNKDYGRTYSFPASSRWLYYSQTMPKASAVNIAQNELRNYSNLSGQANSPAIGNDILQSVNKNYSNQLFAKANAKYLIVPPRDSANDDDFFRFYGDDRNFYVNALNNLPWLEKINTGSSELTVYKNKDYTPYFSSSTELNKIQSFKNIDNYYDFKKAALANDHLEFVGSDNKDISKNTNAPLQTIDDIADDITSKNIGSSDLFIQKNLEMGKTNTAYINPDVKNYSYEVKDNNIYFNSSSDSSLSIDSKELGKITPIKTFYNSQLNNSLDYQFAIGDTLNDIDSSSTTLRNIGTTKESLRLYSSQKNLNLIKNGSFENSLWEKDVQDCNNYDQNAQISAHRVNTKFTDGEYSLELGAKKHTACTRSNTISVTPGQTYSLTYNYQLKGGQKAGYRLNFDNSTILNEEQIKNTGKWYTLSTVFRAPPGSSTVSLYLLGFPDETGKKSSETYYDQVSIKPLALISTITEKQVPTYIKTSTENQQVNIKVNSKDYSYKNLIRNPSLETGLWQKNVGDCNSYDDKPKLGMSLNESEKTKGKQSLELTAARHVACTSPGSVPVEEGRDYLVSFDYQSPNSLQAGYYISFDDPGGSFVTERLNIKDQNWQTLTKLIKIPYGAKNMSLSVYGYSDEDGGVNRITRYDNLSFTKVPPISDRYYLVSTSKKQLKHPKNVSYTLDSPTLKHIKITGAATGFYLNMSEAYNTGWRLQLDDSKLTGIRKLLPGMYPNAISQNDHFKYNDFLNSWYVNPAELCKEKNSACTTDKDGSYNMQLVAEFTPQRSFYVGLGISGLTLSGCLGYLARNYFVKRGKFKGWRYVGRR